MIKKKNLALIIIATFIFTALLSCGIFALADSVKFKLGITLKPSVYFALSLNINGNGEQWIFDNRPTNAHVVEDWATVKNLTIALDNDLISTANSLELKVYNYNANKFMSFEIYDTAGGVLSTNKPSLKNIEYNTSQSLALSNNAIIEGKYTFKVVAEMYDTQISKCNVYVNNIKYDVAYNGVNYIKQLEFYDSLNVDNTKLLCVITTVKINGENFASFAFNDTTHEITISGTDILGDIEIFFELKTKYWDGSVATQFSGGDGTENNPFLISNGQELAYFSSVVNSAATSVISAGQQVNISAGFAGAYLNLTNDIYLNDETFEFDFDTGLTTATDEINTVFIGSGMAGQNSSSVFYSTASTMGNFYTSNTSTTSTSPTLTYGTTGKLNTWTPAGSCSENHNGLDESTLTNPFRGNFNGCQYNIYGMYVNNTNLSSVGLCGSSCGSISNINIHDSLIVAGSHIGLISGANQGASIDSCNALNSTVFCKENKYYCFKLSYRILRNCKWQQSLQRDN